MRRIMNMIPGVLRCSVCSNGGSRLNLILLDSLTWKATASSVGLKLRARSSVIESELNVGDKHRTNLLVCVAGLTWRLM